MKKQKSSKRPTDSPPPKESRRRAGKHPAEPMPVPMPVRNIFGRVVGAIEGSTLRKYAKGSTHMLRKPQGWAWDMSILEQAHRAEVRLVEVIDTEAGVVYRASLGDFSNYGSSFDRGYGPQTCLPLRHWEVAEWKPSSLITATQNSGRRKSPAVAGPSAQRSPSTVQV